MIHDNNNQLTVFVELDALLDTRMGTLARMSDDLALKTLQAGYHHRDTDVFELADMKTYHALYAQRDSETLSKSMCTGLLPEMKRLVGVLTEQAISRPYYGRPKIVVNLHPYSESLTSEDKDEMLKALAVWLDGTSAEVEFTSVSQQSLTPALCKAQGFAGMILYHFNEWMDCHAQAFKTTRLGDITLFGPAIYSVRPTDDELAREIKEAMHPFRAAEMLASPLINLQLIDVSFFSLITSRK